MPTEQTVYYNGIKYFRTTLARDLRKRVADAIETLRTSEGYADALGFKSDAVAISKARKTLDKVFVALPVVPE